MYLSRVTPLPHAASTRSFQKLFEHGPYELHRLIWRLFTDDGKRQHLFRAERTQTGLPLIYTLSSSKPNESVQFLSVQSKKFDPKLSPGTRLGFSLRINPTVSKGNKRHDVLMNAKREHRSKGLADNALARTMEEAAQHWFAAPERLDRWGFSLDFMPEVNAYTQHKTTRNDRAIRFSSVDLEGVLTIASPEKFLPQLQSGFGKARAFGCGLMLIRRV